MQSLDEAALRRPSFDSKGYSVELADGNRWAFPAIRTRAYPVEAEDGSIGVDWRTVYADEVAEDVDTIFGVTQKPFADVVEAEMRLAAHLLKSNYDLPKGAVGRLLSRTFGEPESEKRWKKIQLAILGRNPDVDDEGGDDPKASGPSPSGSN